jgi:hypothetical protein
VLELHAGHPQAHLTRYTALYSSLSTGYELQFDDPSALARPFLPTPSPDRLWPMTFQRDEGVHVSGFQVDSSSTGFIHSEQMWDPGGTLQLVGETVESSQIENGTRLNLRQVQVLYRAPDGLLLTGRLNELPAGAASRVVLERHAAGQEESDGGGAAGGGVDVRRLVALAQQGIVLQPGDARLVAWTDDPLSGLTIQPAASQSRGRTVVLVNLRYGPLPAPRPDANLMVDVYNPAANPKPAEDDLGDFPDTKDDQPPR